MALRLRLEPSTRRSAAIVATLAVLVVVATSPRAALAIKWPSGCPDSRPEPVAAGSRMFASSPFVHPGHEIGFFLEEKEARRRGFSIEPDGNTVQIVFRPLVGKRIALPPFRVTAVSPSALYFDFPDTREVLGRVVAGPVQITIRNARKNRRARQPVALPPSNDALDMLEHGHSPTVLGAVDRAHRLWIPLEFSRFGPGMPMPTCPVELTAKTAFAVKLVPTQTEPDDVLPHASYTNLRKAKLYFGDFLLNGINVYGGDAQVSFDVREFKEGAAIVCGLNDALSLVLMVPLKESALGPRSTILPHVADGAPLPIALADISAEPFVASELRTITHDSFGNQCPAPPEHGDD